jgi:hypothetical protein
MQATSDTQLPPVNPAANSTVKFTGTQCAEMAKKIWKWVDRSASPAVLVLPSYDKFNASPNENTIEVLGYENMGQISSAGKHVPVEWNDGGENPEPAYLLFEFDGNKPAQAFSKRLHRKKHQVLIVGDDCVRIVKITPRTKPATNPESGQRSAAPNGVICVGQELTEGEMNYFASLPCDSYNALVRHLKKTYRTGEYTVQTPPALVQPENAEESKNPEEIENTIEMAESTAALIYDKFADCLVYAEILQQDYPDYQPPWSGVNQNNVVPWTAEGQAFVKAVDVNAAPKTKYDLCKLTRAMNSRGILPKEATDRLKQEMVGWIVRFWSEPEKQS